MSSSIESVDSSDRGPGEYLLFAIVFFALLSAAGSVILDLPALALFFALVIVLAVTCFAVARED